MSQETFGRYRNLVPLGEGGMGQVFLARAVGPAGFAKPVVLKRMHVALAKVPELVERFLGEARVQANLQCPNIVQVLDFGRMDDTYFLVLEYVHGVDLGVLLRASNGPLPIGVAVRIAADACRGLDYAHRARGPSGERLALVHRDVSPQNVLISYEGDVKLGDFGLARIGEVSDAQPGVIIGKPAYLSPEQARGESASARSDLFALGTVLYFQLTGRTPFKGENRAETLTKVIGGEVEPVEDLRPDVPSALAALLRRAMDPDPEKRFPDAAAMLAELESVAMMLGPGATLRAVRDHVQSAYPGAAERDPWADEGSRPVLLELSRLVAEDGVTVLTAADRPAPSAVAPLRRPRWLGALGIALSCVLVILVVAAFRGGSGPPVPRERPAVSHGPRRDPVTTGEPVREAAPARRTPPAEPLLAPEPIVAPAPAPAPRRRAPTTKRPAAPPEPPPPVAAVEPERRMGRLRVGTTPGWGWVFVDGRRMGTTPLSIEIEAGVHQVRVVGPTGRERESTVRVDPGRLGSVFLESFE